jgi:GT2 family glycosyltransferase
VHGKFLVAGGERLFVRGVTYGTFRPDATGTEFPAPGRVELDFGLMARSGVNAVRTYTPAPVWLLDAALRHGLRVMVGLPVERSAAFFDYRNCARSIERMVRSEVRATAGHPAILCRSIGNEIPASVARWHGRGRVESFLKRLFHAAKDEDPDGLVTYVNYPSTEYLLLPFLDLLAFNVYLESRKRFEKYLARLHNIAEDRPLFMAEIGLDSLRNGGKGQAAAVEWQVRSSFASGCAGAFVYSWTDEWFRGGSEVKDWRFGITDEDRRPKPALAVVRRAFAEVPFPRDTAWPRISVVVCSYDGARTIRECCERLRSLEYPDYEVIVVDDGSKDDTAAIAAEFGFRVIRRAANRGLSSARNVGLRAATGDIVAYIDDDAYPDRHWLQYLAHAFFERGAAGVAGVGGPNLPPPGDGLVADCVARAPGGPSHVLLSDRRAEHIPGCNMAFRRSSLLEVGGFDAQFRVAGDDVDLCWRLLHRGWTLRFSPAAIVWHHRRGSVRGYLRQQRGYGRAEAMLERKWPQKYNAAGHATWSGRIYDNAITSRCWRTGRIYHGVWGLAPFQALYAPPPSLMESLSMMPEWYVLMGGLALLTALGPLWSPLRFSGPLLCVVAAAPVAQAAWSAAKARLWSMPRSRSYRLKLYLLTACLHVLQPLARLYGRLEGDLRFRGRARGWGLPSLRPWTADLWIDRSPSVDDHLRFMEAALRDDRHVVRSGTVFDRWDLEVTGGVLGSARLSAAVEYHGDGRQLVRIRCWPRLTCTALALISLFSAFALGAALDRSWSASSVLGSIAALLALATVRECASSTTAFLYAVRRFESEEGHAPSLRKRASLWLRLARRVRLHWNRLAGLAPPATNLHARRALMPMYHEEDRDETD